MTVAPFQLDSLTPHNLQVMQAYSVKAATAKATLEGFDGWLERIDTLPNLNHEQLTQLHGQLIALGFLKFEISGRSVGLRYQISTKGKQALERAEANGSEDDADTTAASDDVTDDAHLADAA